MRFARSIFAASLATASLLSGATGAVWLDVPYVRQSPEGCGSASIAMLVEYWRQHGAAVPSVREEEIFRELHEPGGIPAKAVARYMKDAGFTTFAFAGMWSDLETHLAQGRPLIVAFDGGAFDGGRGLLHYAVVAGISSDTVSVNDPADRKLRQYSRADFEQKWSASQRWTLLAVPASVR